MKNHIFSVVVEIVVDIALLMSLIILINDTQKNINT